MNAFARKVLSSQVLVAVALMLILQGSVALVTQAEASQIIDIFSGGTSWELPCCLEEWQSQCPPWKTAFAYCGMGCENCGQIQCYTTPPEECLF